MNHPLVRRFLGILAGLLAGMATVALIESAGHAAFPPPPYVDLTRPEDLAHLMDVVPLPAKLIVLLGWFLGPLIGALIANRIVRDWRPGWIIAGLFIVMTAITIAQFPHPLWMIVAGLIAPLGAGWTAMAVSARRREGR